MLWLDRVTFILLCALIFVLPASIAGVAIFAIPAIALFLVRKFWGLLSRRSGQAAQSRRPVFALPSSITIPVVLYLLVALLSVFLSCDMQLSLRGFVGKLLQVALLFFVIIDTLSTRRRIYTFLMCFLVSAFILSLDGLWQFFSGWDIFKHYAIIEGRVRASMRHPNDLGAYLIIILPLMFWTASQLWSDWRKNKGLRYGLALVGSLVCSGAAFVVLTLTYSRSAWLGFLVGMGLWAMVRRSWKIFAFFTFLFIFILTPMAVSKRVLPESNLLIQSHEAAPESPRNDVAKLEHSESDLLIKRPEVVSRGAVVASGKGIFGRFLDILDRGLSSSDRLHYWEAAVRIIKDHPLTGAGLNTYSKVIKEYSSYYHFYVHNCYLQVAAELGLPGLAVLLWVLFTPLVFALRRIRAIADPLWSGILGAVAAGYIAVLAESALDTTFYSVQLSTMIWIVMALLVAIPRACEAK